jgi:hypothetical protein
MSWLGAGVVAVNAIFTVAMAVHWHVECHRAVLKMAPWNVVMGIFIHVSIQNVAHNNNKSK